MKEKRPKPLHYALPAGTVYWCKVIEGKNDLHRLWGQSISDNEQARRDGYSIVAPGVWYKHEEIR